MGSVDHDSRVFSSRRLDNKHLIEKILPNRKLPILSNALNGE